MKNVLNKQVVLSFLKGGLVFVTIKSIQEIVDVGPIVVFNVLAANNCFYIMAKF